MTLYDLFRKMKGWPAIALAASIMTLHPAAAFAGLSATATIASAPASGGLYHYNLVLTNNGTTPVGTFWFAWEPGAGFMTQAPSNIVSPLNWTEKTTENGGAIQWVASTPLAPGKSLSGFSFDSPLTPAQMAAASSNGPPVDSSFVYIGAPLGDPGEQITPTASQLSAKATIASTTANGGFYHYNLVLTNTGTTTIGTFWFAWEPGAGLMPQLASNIQSPLNWTEKTTENGAGIQWVTPAPIAPGTSVTGFAFDSPLSPAEMAAASSSGPPVDTTFVFIGAPLADAGQEIAPTPSLLSGSATITATPGGSGLNHYELVLTDSGSTTIGTFWFAWEPGAGLMAQPPTNIQAPPNWTFKTTENGAGLQWVTSSPITPGTVLPGFSFDSPLTPAQIAGPSSTGPVTDTTFLFIGAPLADPGQEIVPVTNTPVVASVLPGSRSVQLGASPTVFADMVNDSSVTLSGCQIGLPASAPAGLALTYQTSDPTTNALTGTPNTPATITPGKFQTFVLDFTSSAALSAAGLAPVFQCTSTWPVTTVTGVNTVDLSFSPTPVADVIALAATSSGNGIVTVPFSAGGAGAFAVATDNLGAADTITAEADTGTASLPITLLICQTNPSTAACLAAPAPTVTVSDTAGATSTFSVFATASSAVAFDPANSRIFVRFKDAGGTSHGSTSVAVQTN